MRRQVVDAFVQLTVFLLLLTSVTGAPASQSSLRDSYFGTLIGKVTSRSNNVTGDVYAVDEQTLFIRQFNYDGLAPDAYFWSSVSSPQPGASDAFIVPDEKGSTKPLERYSDKDVVLRLPEGKTLREINWICVWSRLRKENLGDILISKNLVIPRPLEISAFSQLAHGLKSGPITIVDAQTFLVPDFHYDGLGPAAFFWLTRGASGLNANGLRLKDENGSGAPLRKYSGETVVITLPEELTVYDFDFFGVWCKEFQVNFGQTRIPQTAKVPPSPKMLGIKPENKLNCEILYDDLGYEIRWVLDGDDIVMQLVGKIEPNEYMAFGLGKDDSKSDMKNADAVVTWVDRTSGQVHAVDYFLGAKQQCVNDPQGSCPDVKLQGGGDSLTLLHGAIVNGYSMVTFKRPQLGIDELYDQHVYSDGQQSVLWAIGTLNAKKEIGYHRLKTRSNMFIDFARNPQWNCPIPDLNASMHNNLPVPSASQLDPTVVSAESSRQSGADSDSKELARNKQPEADLSRNRSADAIVPTNHSAEHWFVPAVACPQDRTFYAQLGPAAGRKGYEGVTGHASWGSVWYVNGLLAPELVVERGHTYRFVVEGGNERTSAESRHPFYLTDSPDGGFDFKPDEQRLQERIFAGVALRPDGQFVPTAEGRLCEWRPTNATLTNADLYPTFAAYQRTLKLNCVAGQASMLKFAPDSNTPDLIYYQCYTHRFMGWRIRVVNSCANYINSNNKRQVNNKRRSTYNRRSLSASENLKSLESRMSFELQLPPFPATSGEFADEPAAGSLSAELATLPADMLILNNSQLVQRQPMNLSSFDEILKLSPADLEFIDNQPETPLDTYLQMNALHQQRGFQNNFNFSTNQMQQDLVRPENKSKSGAKTLQSYMRRLASIYYPVQQQLASMLASQSGQPIGSSGSSSSVVVQMQPAPQSGASSVDNQASSFSLSNLVPKSKIDLSKSTITKKLNKLRFKSGRKFEPKPSQPPQPTTEFNYDIFNNQLAQLEKQQKQFELSNWTNQNQAQSSPEASYNYLPMMSSEEQQQAIDSINFQSQAFLNNLPMYQNTAQSQQNQWLKPQGYSERPMQPTRFSEVPLGPPNQMGQQPYVIDYLSMMTNTNSSKPSWIQPPSQMHFSSNPPKADRQRPIGLFGQQQQQQQQQPSVFITRVPQPQSAYPQAFPKQQHVAQTPQQQQSQDFHRLQWAQPNTNSGSAQNGARYPNIQPYSGPRQTSESLRFPQTGFRDQDFQQVKQQMSSIPNEQPEMESLSGSGSGAYFDFRQQPVAQQQQQSNQKAEVEASVRNHADLDHMMAIERFSKQSSERWPSSMTLAGEHIQLPDHNNLEQNQKHEQHSNQSKEQIVALPRRFSAMLIDKHLVASSEPTPIQSDLLIDADQANAVHQASDLKRINMSEPMLQLQQAAGNLVLVSTRLDSNKIQRIGNFQNLTHQQQVDHCNGDSCLQLQTTESTPTSVLVKPSNTFDFLRDFLAASTTTSTAGPLTPSFGPPVMQQPVNNLKSNDLETETIIKSTLIEPLSSTLSPVANSSIASQVHNKPSANFANLYFNRPNFDSSPFTPIEITNPMYYSNQLQQQQISRLRPPSLVESMINQHQAPYRPEPPVQVASYLAHHLTSHSPMFISSERSVASNQPVALSISNPPNINKGNATSDLIILKPALITKQIPQTYLLKPEYLTNQFKLNNENSLSSSNQVDNDPYTNELTESSRRIAGHQFDRLSSLSSPPSTSMALDPMLMAHNMAISSYIKHNGSDHKAPHSKHVSNGQLTNQISSTLDNLHSKSILNDMANNLSDSNKLAQHRQQAFITSKPIPLNLEPDSSSNIAAGVRINPGGDNINTLYRDNNTDNAILSHVMSLISSNAIPTPPLIPTNSYSSADYFLPFSDRIHRSLRG